MVSNDPTQVLLFKPRHMEDSTRERETVCTARNRSMLFLLKIYRVFFSFLKYEVGRAKLGVCDERWLQGYEIGTF